MSRAHAATRRRRERARGLFSAPGDYVCPRCGTAGLFPIRQRWPEHTTPRGSACGLSKSMLGRDDYPREPPFRR